MKTDQLSLSTPCPACQSQLHLKALGCSHCGCEVRGAISLSPLARLSDDMSHFLMVFVHCGGKIGEVEKALGISYPTVKAKLSELQKALSPEQETSLKTGVSSQVMELLEQFEAGEISYEEMGRLVKKLKENQ